MKNISWSEIAYTQQENKWAVPELLKILIDVKERELQRLQEKLEVANDEVMEYKVPMKYRLTLRRW